MLRFFRSVILVLLFTLPVSAMAPATESFFQSLQSPVIEIIDSGHPFYHESLGEYPWYARLLQQEFLKANPTGKPFWTKPECQFKIWQERALQSGESFAKFSSNTEKFLKDCESVFQTGQTNILSNTIFAMNLQLDVRNHPYARHVILNLPSGVKLKGLLAMKPDGQKRPLIIFRTGIFSNTQEFYPERYLFMMGFEQSPFNMLVIESISGSEFVKHNNSFSLGGFDEGMQNFWIARELQNSKEPISRSIQSVHLLGMSMGGHGVMFASLLNELNPLPDAKGNEAVISSSVALCPLLNVQDTLDFHQTQGFTMFLMNTWAAKRLEILRERNPHLGVATFIEDSFDELKKNYHQSMLGGHANIRLPEEMNHIEDSQTGPGLYWRLNNFWPAYKNIKTPVFILSTKHDPIVSWFINSGRLLDGRLDLSSSNVKLFPFNEGYHCSLSVAYDWEKMATLLQTFFLKYSRGFQQVKKEIRVPLTKSVLDYQNDSAWLARLQSAFGENKNSTPVIDMNLEIPRGESSVSAQLHFYKVPRPNLIDRWLAPRMNVTLPLSEMEYPRDGVVEDKAEHSLLTRWANQNIQVRIDGEDLVFSWPVTR